MIVIKEEKNMINQRVEELEQKRIDLFRKRDILIKEKRSLSKEKEKQQEKLDYELELEKEFGVMCNNLNLGRGKYYELSNLPYVIRENMLNPEYENLSEEEKDKMKTNLEFAIKISDEINQEYEHLMDTRSERLQKIRDYKRNLQVIKRQLYKATREEKKKVLKAKKLDRKIDYLKDKGCSNKVTFKLR